MRFQHGVSHIFAVIIVTLRMNDHKRFCSEIFVPLANFINEEEIIWIGYSFLTRNTQSKKKKVHHIYF
jgi:hypothetical protein